MKKVLLIALLALFSVQAMADRIPNPRRTSISAGFMQGGGGLLGVDFEFMLNKHVSATAGVGFISCGASLNYHFKPYINSSMISVVYWNQGIMGESFSQAMVGPVFTYRAPKVFQFQIGAGARVAKGPALNSSYADVPFMLLYSIGVYFPL